MNDQRLRAGDAPIVDAKIEATNAIDELYDAAKHHRDNERALVGWLKRLRDEAVDFDRDERLTLDVVRRLLFTYLEKVDEWGLGR